MDPLSLSVFGRICNANGTGAVQFADASTGEIKSGGTYRSWNLIGRGLRSGTSKEANNIIRTELLRSLASALGCTKFGDNGKLTADTIEQIQNKLGGEGVLCEKGSDAFKLKDGKVVSGSPLTERRITTILTKAKEALDKEALDSGVKREVLIGEKYDSKDASNGVKTATTLDAVVKSDQKSQMQAAKDLLKNAFDEAIKKQLMSLGCRASEIHLKECIAALGENLGGGRSKFVDKYVHDLMAYSPEKQNDIGKKQADLLVEGLAGDFDKHARTWFAQNIVSKLGINEDANAIVGKLSEEGADLTMLSGWSADVGVTDLSKIYGLMNGLRKAIVEVVVTKDADNVSVEDLRKWGQGLMCDINNLKTDILKVLGNKVSLENTIGTWYANEIAASVFKAGDKRIPLCRELKHLKFKDLAQIYKQIKDGSNVNKIPDLQKAVLNTIVDDVIKGIHEPDKSLFKDAICEACARMADVDLAKEFCSLLKSKGEKQIAECSKHIGAGTKFADVPLLQSIMLSVVVDSAIKKLGTNDKPEGQELVYLRASILDKYAEAKDMKAVADELSKLDGSGIKELIKAAKEGLLLGGNTGEAERRSAQLVKMKEDYLFSYFTSISKVKQDNSNKQYERLNNKVDLADIFKQAIDGHVIDKFSGYSFGIALNTLLDRKGMKFDVVAQDVFLDKIGKLIENDRENLFVKLQQHITSTMQSNGVKEVDPREVREVIRNALCDAIGEHEGDLTKNAGKVGGWFRQEATYSFDMALRDNKTSKVTSTFTPAPVQDPPDGRLPVANLGISKLEVQVDGKNKELVSFVRFGQVGVKLEVEANEKLREAASNYHYLKIAELMLRNDQAKLKKLQDNPTQPIEVPIFRIDMCADKDESMMTTPSKIMEGTVKIDGQDRQVQSKLYYFHVPIDDNHGYKDDSRIMRTFNDLDALIQLARTESRSPLMENTKRNKINSLVSELGKFQDNVLAPMLNSKENLTTKDKNEAFLRFGSQVAMLVSLLGNKPAINCTCGRDRTGAMDSEIKLLACHLEKGEGAAFKSGMIERTAFLNKTGNNDMAFVMNGDYRGVNVKQSESNPDYSELFVRCVNEPSYTV